jgi:hypothetical protein
MERSLLPTIEIYNLVPVYWFITVNSTFAYCYMYFTNNLLICSVTITILIEVYPKMAQVLKAWSQLVALLRGV